MNKSFSRKMLLVVLTLSLTIEIMLTLGGFFFPEFMMTRFKISPSTESLFLGYVLTWCFLIISIFCAFALYLVNRSNKIGYWLVYILGFWWMGIGLALYFKYGLVENLFMDFVKGLLLTIGAYICSPIDLGYFSLRYWFSK